MTNLKLFLAVVLMLSLTLGFAMSDYNLFLANQLLELAKLSVKAYVFATTTRPELSAFAMNL